MCGICGLAARDPRAVPIDEPTLRTMTDAIEHRGPDDAGQHVSPGASLGMRRLSIIDIEGSRQPLANEDETVWTVFNGEIFNFRELRDELASRGHTLRTNGDAETIVHLYEEMGPAFTSRLRGMFAIAVWDTKRRRLVLTRDRMGVKPLYLAEVPGGLAFASEVRSLIAGGIVEPSLDGVAAELFMAYGYVPGPRTLFEGVRKLMPATTLVWEDGSIVSETEYWSAADEPPQPAPGRDWQEDQERLLALLREAVRMRLISDVPLGVMLSGGLDSSLITSLMAEASTGPVRTFSIGFAEDGAANELPEARSVAEALGTDHHELVTSAFDHPGLLDEVLSHLEEPVADLSCLGFMLLSRLARENVTVALSGQGADELLGGYRKHQIARAAGIVGHGGPPVRAAMSAAARLAPPGSTVARGLAAAAASDGVDRMLAMSRVLQPHERPVLFTDRFLRAGAEEEIRGVIAQHLPPDGLTVLGETLHLDSKLALVDNMFLYFDKMSMAASLEVRVPFMDHPLVSYCAALPDSRRVFRGRRKELLRRVSHGLVPEPIIQKKKQGFFHSALGAWLRAHGENLFTDVLLDERARDRGLYDEAGMRALIDSAGTEGKKASQRLFCVFLLEKWQRLYVDADGAGRRARQAVPAAL